VDLVDARYGALGVLGPSGGLSRFIHVRLDEATGPEGIVAGREGSARSGQRELLSGATEDDALRLIAQRILELVRADTTIIVLGPDGSDRAFPVRAQCGYEETSLLGPGDPYGDVRPAHRR